jgi:hypothetical protein
VNPGDKVYLHLDPKSCNGLPADDTEGVEETMVANYDKESPLAKGVLS